MSTAKPPTAAGKPSTAVAVHGMPLSGLEDLQRLSEILFKGGAAAGCGRPETVAAVILMGLEVGLKPMQALQSIKIVNGRASIWGDAMLALVRGSGKLGSMREWIEGEGDTRTAHCEVVRVGEPVREFRFSVGDAKRANLWTKKGPWQEYPERMLQARARGFALRDVFPDALAGLISTEESDDIPHGPQVSVVTPAAETPPVAPLPVAAVSPPAPTPAAAVNGELMITDDQLKKIASLREGYLVSKHKVCPEDKDAYAAAWTKTLSRWNVTSAKQLTSAQAEELYAEVVPF